MNTISQTCRRITAIHPKSLHSVVRTRASAILLSLACPFVGIAHAATCSVAATPLSFGSYDVLSGAAATGTSTLSVTCTKTAAGLVENVNVSVFLATGPGTYANRTLLSGANVLNYNLYVDSTYAASAIWGNGTLGTTFVGGTIPLFSFLPTRTATATIYGQVPGSQDVASGAYAANVTITITF